MKRKSTSQKINNLLSDFRNKVSDIAIRTTLIVGYPGETDEDFSIIKKNGLRILNLIGLVALHIPTRKTHQLIT